MSDETLAAFEQYILDPDPVIAAVTAGDLSLLTPANGGYLVPSELDPTII